VVGSIDISNSSANVTGSIPVRAFDSDNNAVSNVKIEPKYIDVTVPVKLSKEVPIVVKTTGRIADGKAIKNIKPEVESVIIIGDKKYLDKIKQIETTAFDISTLAATSSKSLMLNIPTNISIFNDIRSINVDFMVENIIEKTIDVSISLVNENTSYNYSLSNTVIPVTVSGLESIVNSENISGVTASVDLLGFEEGSHNLTVKINLPDGLEIKGNPNDKVTVNITKK
jgi:YbbR domain-containing protein